MRNSQGVRLREGLEDIDVQIEILDLASLASIVSFVRRVKVAGLKVDVLINNAGIFGVPRRRETEDGLEMHMGVNHFGPHLLTRLLEPMLVDGGRVVFLSSMAHDKPPAMPATIWDWDNINFEKHKSYDRVQAYGRSKLATILDATAFATRLASRGINTYAVHPGLVKTEIHRSMTDNGTLSLITGVVYSAIGWVCLSNPLKGALTTLRVAVDPTLGEPEFSGKYWGDEKEARPSTLALNPASPPRLWAYTEDVLEAKLGKKVNEVLV